MSADRWVRWAWAVFGLAFGTWLATLIGYVVLRPVTTSDWGGGDILANLPFIVMVLAFDVIGVLITTRRPGNSIGWLVLGIGLSWSAGDLLGALATYAFDHGWSNADVLIALSQPTWLPPIALTGTFLILLFPDGHLPSRRWRWFARTIAVGMTVVGLVLLLGPGTFEDSGYPTVTNPLGIEAIRPLFGVFMASLLIIPIGMLGSMVALVQRFRRSVGVERQQMKWLAYAAAVAACTYAGVMVASILKGDAPVPGWLLVWQNLALAALALIPIAIGIAVLKYRLYDIDVVINRTIVFGALAAFIGAVDVAVVVLLGSAIGATTSNPALSIAATAIVALLFEPVRVRVQRVANRFVYGERATPYEVLSRFSERIAGTYATEDVLPRTARVIAEGTGAERVGVWLRVGDVLQERGSWPAADGSPAPIAMAGRDLPAFPGTDATVPVRHREELLGAVTVTKPRGEAMTPAEASLLADLAGQAGLVLSNVRLTAELQARLDEIARRSEELRASRQRIVTTQDAERRRLERNIHDGAQQHLVALAVKLRLVRSMLAKDPDRATAVLGELRAEVDEAIETLSSLALGIYPPVLEERGIAAALESQVRAGAVPVRVVADGVGPPADRDGGGRLLLLPGGDPERDEVRARLARRRRPRPPGREPHVRGPRRRRGVRHSRRRGGLGAAGHGRPAVGAGRLGGDLVDARRRHGRRRPRPRGGVRMTSRTATRLAWGSWAVFVVVAAGGTLIAALGDGAVSLSDSSQLLAFTAVITVGAIVASHRPGNPLGWIYIALAMWMMLSGGLAANYALLSDGRAGGLPGGTFAEWLSNWGWAPSVGLLITFVFLLFPDGHLPSPRWRPVAWLAAGGTAALAISFMFQSADYTDSAGRHVPNPFTTPGLARFFDVAKVPSAFAMLGAAVVGRLAVRAVPARRSG